MFSESLWVSNHSNRVAGTAIWVYCILVESALPQYTAAFGSNISFELDGHLEGLFTHVLNDTFGDSSKRRQLEVSAKLDGEYLYNRTVFGITGLNNQNHTLKMTAVRGTNASILLFDWAQYM